MDIMLDRKAIEENKELHRKYQQVLKEEIERKEKEDRLQRFLLFGIVFVIAGMLLVMLDGIVDKSMQGCIEKHGQNYCERVG